VAERFEPDWRLSARYALSLSTSSSLTPIGMAHLSLSFASTLPPAHYGGDLLSLVAQLVLDHDSSWLLAEDPTHLSLCLGLTGIVRTAASAHDILQTGSTATRRAFLDHVEDADAALALWRRDAEANEMLTGAYGGSHDAAMRLHIPKKLCGW
jgi:hypothetical protein